MTMKKNSTGEISLSLQRFLTFSDFIRNKTNGPKVMKKNAAEIILIKKKVSIIYLNYFSNKCFDALFM